MSTHPRRYLFGPMREDSLTIKLLTFQALCTALAFLVRYQFAALFYDAVE